MLELDCGATFDAARDEEFFATLPPRPAVVLLEPARPAELVSAAAGGHNDSDDVRPSADGVALERPEPYLLRTADLRRRLERLLRAPEAATLPDGCIAPQAKRLNLRGFAAGVRYRLTGSAFEQSLAYYQHARANFPRRYRDLARLRPPALLKVNLANAYPRCYVTRRIFADGGAYFGPFASRKAAEAFSSEFLNLFKIRRCQIKIRRDPAFPGCIYSEMKMCLAPCFAGCSKEEYETEVGRVASFLQSAGTSYTGELEREREAASEATDYERAAAVHTKIEKAAHILRDLPEVARRVEELDAAILQRAAAENAVAVFEVRGGRIADPFLLNFDELAGQPRSVEQILRERLEPNRLKPQINAEERGLEGSESKTSTQRHSEGAEVKETAGSLGGRAEGDVETLRDHLSLLARWFYSRPRAGEIFFREARSGARTRRGDWPYRRILRGCSRVLAPQPSLPFEATSGKPADDPKMENGK
ncbi:MAG: UvrB/UvrC motif-containing protein [Candidatus Acidiferrales bacterium]